MLKEQLDKAFEENPFLNLNEAVYCLLYRNIINLSLKPGSSLSETSLAKELELSRTPIRNALLLLQESGLVIRNKGQAFFVAPLGKEECQQLMEIRYAIEGKAVYLAAERISEQNLSKLAESLKKYLNACKLWNIEEIILNDHNFHQDIIDSAENAFFSSIYRKIAPRVLHYWHFLFHQADENILMPIMGISARQHRSIYHAVRLGFGTAAQERMERDIAGMIDIIRNW